MAGGPALRLLPIAKEQGTRMRSKKLKLAMWTYLRFRSISELRHCRSCEGCGKRFSEQDMVWIDTEGWLCSKCQNKIA